MDLKNLKTVIYEKKGRIAYITLNRPERYNAVNPEMTAEMEQVWDDYKNDDEVWVAIITGAGKAFCAGGDLKELSSRYESDGAKSMVGRRSQTERLMAGRWKVSPGMCDVWKPVIAAVNGIVAGGGLHFLGECDFAICSENASFTDPHVTSGLVTAIETLRLSRRIPMAIVLRMAMMGRYERISAQRAYEVGMVTEIVPHDKLMARATEIAEAICKNSPYAVRMSKIAIAGGLEMNLRDATDLAWYIVEEVNTSDDTKEAIKAFTEKRSAQWKLR